MPSPIQFDLFVKPDAPQHDPGGRVRLPLQPGVRGFAEFSACGRYRHWLSRTWSLGEHADITPYVLWIGMNPSTAEGNVDDPTIRKEMKFTRAWGYSGYVKVNVMDFRATDRTTLLIQSQPVSSSDNSRHIRHLVASASMVVAAWGALPGPLRRFAREAMLMVHPHLLWCVGVTKDGSPRHPLCVRDDTVPVRWAGHQMGGSKNRRLWGARTC